MATHGEYKTPGGKLVVVDLSVTAGRLTGVTVSGDFFVYPDEAFPLLREALEGQPAGLDQDELAARVRERLPEDVELLGTSPEGIAIAVRRALAAGEGVA